MDSTEFFRFASVTLNVVQAIALAYIAAKYPPSRRNGKQEDK